MKPGDKVRCVRGYVDSLVEGEIYTIWHIVDYEIQLVEVDGYWSGCRFELVRDTDAPAAPEQDGQSDQGRRMKYTDKDLTRAKAFIEAGTDGWYCPPDTSIAQLIADVRREERERCAKIAAFYRHMVAGKEIADQIRGDE